MTEGDKMTTEEQKAWDMPEKIAVMMADRLQICSPDFQHTLYHRDDIVKALEAQNKILAEAITAIKAKVVMQADDEGLWFYAKNASEGYLQQELRKLHEAIETHAEAIALAQRIGVK